jgi:hypothetical protein
MGTDSRKDIDKDRRMPGHEDGGDTLRRIEVITGTGRRRRWDAETKGRLVAGELRLPSGGRCAGGMLGVFAEFESNLRRERSLKESPRPKPKALQRADAFDRSRQGT